MEFTLSTVAMLLSEAKENTLKEPAMLLFDIILILERQKLEHFCARQHNRSLPSVLC